MHLGGIMLLVEIIRKVGRLAFRLLDWKAGRNGNESEDRGSGESNGRD